jgi:hypothetical protein
MGVVAPEAVASISICSSVSGRSWLGVFVKEEVPRLPSASNPGSDAGLRVEV